MASSHNPLDEKGPMRERIEKRINELDGEIKNPTCSVLFSREDLKSYKKMALENLIKSLNAKSIDQFLLDLQDAKKDEKLCQGFSSKTEKLILWLINSCEMLGKKPSGFGYSGSRDYHAPEGNRYIGNDRL